MRPPLPRRGAVMAGPGELTEAASGETDDDNDVFDPGGSVDMDDAM